MRRHLGSLLLGLLIVFGLFWLMHWLVQPGRHVPPPAQNVIEAVEMVEVKKEEAAPEEAAAADAPPPPPSAPPSLARPDMPSLSLPASAPVDAGPITIPAINTSSLGLGGSSLGGSGSFGGFAGRGSGSGNGSGGGGGYGKGEGFEGKTLVPLSTARPQMPEWACKQGIRGWVEVVFTVMPNGRVQDVKLIDADPRGVFEAAAIESVGHWIYQSTKKARTVKQRVPMDPEDCIYNWQQ